jgi:hypothetical protein
MPPPATAGPPGIEVGTSSTPPWEGADIFRLYGEPYCRDHPVPPAPQQGIRDLAACRTAPRGGHAARGPTCGVERYAYHSCRHRHCPKCQTFMQVQWGEARTAALLPGPYVPLVFPLPHALNPRRLPHKRPLLTLLFQAARQPRLQFGQRHLGGQSGGTMVRHTWDQTLGAPCHGHCVIAAGARASTGARWREADSRCRSPVRALRTVLRGKCCEALARAGSTGAWAVAEGPTALGSPGSVALLRTQLYATAWVVYAKPPWAGPEQV